MSRKDYKVTIKSANQKTDDYVATCKSEWTVYKLKQHIAHTHVNRPPVEDQRLIYAGRLLNDNHLLRQIFFRDSLCTDQNPDKADFTIHLVCAQRQQSPNASAAPQLSTRPTVVPSTPQGSQRNQGQSSSQFVQHHNQLQETFLSHLVGSSPQHDQQQMNNTLNQTSSNTPNTNNCTGRSIPPPNPATVTATNISNNLTGLNFLYGTAFDPRVAGNPYLTDAVHGNNFTLDPQAQQALFQQMAQLVASQFHQLSVAGSTGSIPISLPSQPNLIPLGTYTISSIRPVNHSLGAQMNVNPFQRLVRGAANPQPPNAGNELNNNEHNLDVGQNPAGAQFREAVPDVGQPRPVQQNENLDGQRHVIDWLYYTFRALVLMTAVYVNSSYKFLFLVAFLAFVYFYKKSVANRRFQRERAQRLDRMRNRNQGINVGDRNDLRNRPNGGNDNAPVSNNGQSNNVQAQLEARLPFFKMIYMVVSSFIISLIPENHV